MNLLFKRFFSQPSKDDLTNYFKKLKFLRGIVDTKKLPSSTERFIASEILSPVTKSDEWQDQDMTKQIHLQNKGKYSSEVRKDLLRRTQLKTNESLTNADIGSVIKYHSNIQEKIADEMLILTRNLKQNVNLSGEIIRSDTEVKYNANHTY